MIWYADDDDMYLGRGKKREPISWNRIFMRKNGEKQQQQQKNQWDD